MWSARQMVKPLTEAQCDTVNKCSQVILKSASFCLACGETTHSWAHTACTSLRLYFNLLRLLLDFPNGTRRSMQEHTYTHGFQTSHRLWRKNSTHCGSTTPPELKTFIWQHQLTPDTHSAPLTLQHFRTNQNRSWDQRCGFRQGEPFLLCVCAVSCVCWCR